MKEFKSAFKPAIEEYLEFRSAMGYCNEHDQQLRYFDKYCYEHFPEQTELTKEVVRGWFYDEIASGRACLSNDSTPVCKVSRFLCVCTADELCTKDTRLSSIHPYRRGTGRFISSRRYDGI